MILIDEIFPIRHLKCNIEACVHDLCQEVLTCELNSDEIQIEGKKTERLHQFVLIRQNRDQIKIFEQ